MAVVQGRVDSSCHSGCGDGDGDGDKEGCGFERPFKGKTVRSCPQILSEV